MSQSRLLPGEVQELPRRRRPGAWLRLLNAIGGVLLGVAFAAGISALALGCIELARHYL